MKTNTGCLPENDLLKTIEEITGRGNTAEVKKNKNGYVILEVKKSIKYGK